MWTKASYKLGPSGLKSMKRQKIRRDMQMKKYRERRKIRKRKIRKRNRIRCTVPLKKAQVVTGGVFI